MAIVAPRWDAGSSRNSNTSGWRSSDLLDDAALHAAAAAVDETDLAQPGGVRRVMYSSTTEGMSRGAKAWRSRLPSMGIRSGS